MCRFFFLIFTLFSFSVFADALEEKAELGNARAQVKLAMEYESGTNRPINIDHAIQWYKQAAMQDNTTAQFNLGQIYKNGYGVAQDIKQAIYWFTRAATQNHPPSQFYLGEIYEYGLSGAVDLYNASLWYQIASNNGHGEAMLGYERVIEEIKIQQQKASQQVNEPNVIESEPEPKTIIIKQMEKPTLLITIGSYLLIAIMGVILIFLLLRLKQSMKQTKSDDALKNSFVNSLHNEKMKQLQESYEKLKIRSDVQESTVKRLTLELETKKLLSQFTPHQLLGVTLESSSSDIKKQYRKLAQLHHPDHGADGVMFAEINKAYHTIKG
ncbi:MULTISPECIES: J domain-containing protein [Aliivibrio]|uniref:J domain-containing protein n=1 Tax=Aliivibrio finisterrensis TaxID=511998 RepID=A0A4Q5KUR0_9GAMM|nr:MULTISPECIES: J domain-containing protein [Aliivibrio]MDD9177702.1 J domain-containing protein [Aliivibrio sp. A6]RYU50904.1 J domain-containing protein [Aliivibrio finisterrensis]RYU51945.1 J domain-containing protein [Aliivibrio finisterrensis]RYU56846.1 J domain-containing protein [Aliivibrio finisterrensis]RYU64658.1 J domain-containing protein [Aliivibrio finisterrensis]